MNILTLLNIFFLSLFCTYLQCEESHYPYSEFVESNIFTEGQRFIKLKDGTYWQMKLKNGIIHADKISGVFWSCHDPVKLYKGTDPHFPYLLENLKCHEIICCKPFDPAVCHQKISIITSKTFPSVPTQTLILYSIIHTGNNLFVQLNDYSYWEIKLVPFLLTKDFKTLSSWSRFDPIIFKLSYDEDFPYYLIHLPTGQQVLCKQVDPAFPSSIHWKYDDDDDDDDVGGDDYRYEDEDEKDDDED